MKKTFIFAAFVFISAIVCANPWSYHGPKRDIVTLVVTANYEKPRLIAELIQYENLQPYLLLPASGNGNIYFCPPEHLGAAKLVKREKLGSTIAFIAPQQIFVLGNEKYVPASYVKELRKIAPVVVINADNWQQAADTIAPMLNLSRLPRDYRNLSAKLKSGRLYTPNKNDGEKAAETKALPADKAEEKNDDIFDEPKFTPDKKEDKKSVEKDKNTDTKADDVAPLA